MKSILQNFILFFAILLTLMSYQRNSSWHSEMFMWIDVISKSPFKARPHNGLGMVYSALDKRAMAIKSFNSAISLDSGFYIAQNNLGAELFREGFHSEALSYFEKAIKMNYDYPEAHNNLGSVYAVTGDLDKAIIEFKIAHKQNSSYIDAMLNLARVFFLKTDNKKASLYLDKVFKLEPMDKEALKLKQML